MISYFCAMWSINRLMILLLRSIARKTWSGSFVLDMSSAMPWLNMIFNQKSSSTLDSLRVSVLCLSSFISLRLIIFHFTAGNSLTSLKSNSDQSGFLFWKDSKINAISFHASAPVRLSEIPYRVSRPWPRHVYHCPYRNRRPIICYTRHIGGDWQTT